MKKPGKAKPKRRAHPAARAKQQAALQPVVQRTHDLVQRTHDLMQRPGDAAIRREAMAPSQRANAPIVQRLPVALASGANRWFGTGFASTRFGNARFGSAGDDNRALLLLMLPFLLVAFSLSLNISRRGERASANDIAVYTPAPAAQAPAAQAPAAQAPAAQAPAVALPQTPPVEITLPQGPVYPPPLPVIEIARVEPRPAPVALTRPSVAELPLTPPVALEVVVPTVSVPYPPPVPDLRTADPSAAMPRMAALDVAPVQPLSRPPEVATAPPVLPAEQSCSATGSQLAAFSTIGRLARAPRQPRLTGVDAATFGQRLAAAAVEQTRDLTIYSARYQAMAYPMGDVVPLHGACIDVVIRAYRALGIDLQEEVQRSRPVRGDPNIDHRRTENMRRFLEKNGASLPITAFPEDYKPGDIVTYHRPFSRVSTSHIAVVTDVLAATGRPMIVHNRGYGAQMEDALFVDRITGHYRYLGGSTARSDSANAGETARPVAGSVGAPVVRASVPAGAPSRPKATVSAKSGPLTE